MLRVYLLEHHPDPRFQISLLEEAMGNFLRYLFIMPILARFELDVHERVERGEGLSADDMIELMADLFAEGYGSEIHVDRERVGITWATFPLHLHRGYYVYQYAVGIAGAYALSQRILSGQDGAVESYLKFLRAGNSMYPLDLLKMAGVDLTKPDAIEDAFRALAEMIDRLEKLIRM
jgi:oligoendopeptidase F